MAQLAIKGHPTRGREIIEILEMLGGENIHNYGGTFNECYIIDNNKICTIYTSVAKINNCIIFTLEEFLEKYPYKVEDKVLYHDSKAYIKSMKWGSREIIYTVEWEKELWETTVFYLQPYKEETMDKAVFDANAQCCDIMNRLIKKETMEEQKKDYEEWFQINYLEFENNDDTWADEVEVNLGKDYEIQIRGDKTFIVKKQLQYPKTYEECCKVLFPNSIAIGKVLTRGYNCELLKKFGELLICRDTYWKIAGEQMGLDKPWKPDWLDTNTQKYCIYYVGDEIKKQPMLEVHHFLAFPTKEMSDIFFENFKDLIEQCKDFL